MLLEIINYFKTGTVPVSNKEALEIFAFLAAADESKLRGGQPVSLKSVMDKAKMEVRKIYKF